MKNLLYVFCFLFFISCNKKNDKTAILEKGISLELAELRKQQVSGVLYDLDFKIPEEKTNPIASKLLLEVSINNLKNDLILDFNEDKSYLKSLKVNGKNSEIKHEKEQLIIDKKLLN